jgi:shikimate kinase
VQQRDGELALRRAESAALAVALEEAPPLVASVAAGVVLDPLDRERLRTGGYVVWLRAELSTLAHRVAGTDRPWLGQDPVRALARLYAGRAELYASVADLVVDVDHRAPAETADVILRALPRRPARR